MPKPRARTTRKTKPRILILCEGEKTEPYYFTALKNDPCYRHLTSVEIVIHDVKINTAKELVNHAIESQKNAQKEGNPFFEIWIVIDKDGYTKHPESFDRASKHSINIAFSSISFEYWLLLHFTFTAKSFSKCDELISFLKKNGLPNYKKTQKIYYEIKDKTCVAIEYAKKLRQMNPDLNPKNPPYRLNPYTNVDTLVCRLIHFEDLKDESNNYIRIPHNNWSIVLSDLICK